MDIGDMVGICTAVAFVFVIVGWFAGRGVMSREHRRAMKALMGMFGDEEMRAMGGFKTVTASEGYRFKINTTEGAFYAQSYRAYGDQRITWLDDHGLPECLLLVPGKRWPIELVPIKEPEPEPKPEWERVGHIHAECFETDAGDLFRVWQRGTNYTRENGDIVQVKSISSDYTEDWPAYVLVRKASPSRDTCDTCDSRRCVRSRCFVEPVQGVWPKGECPICRYKPEPGNYVWEIDATAFCCDGRYETLHIDSDGHWETHRLSTGPKHRVVSAGQAKRVR